MPPIKHIIISLMTIILLICIIHIILLISIILQVHVDLRVANHVWQEKGAATAASIDGLGDKFKPELRAAWMAYIRETYPDGLVEATDIMGTGMLDIDG
jgi:hypothetical protein